MAAPTVWVAKDDGTDIVRADCIAGVGRDYNGNITARLAGAEGSVVTLVVPATSGGVQTSDDFHRQLIRIIAGLAHAPEPIVIRPACDHQRTWRWVTEPL
jgi:hypothetical protein